jgi:hypothetical protein
VCLSIFLYQKNLENRIEEQTAAILSQWGNPYTTEFESATDLCGHSSNTQPWHLVGVAELVGVFLWILDKLISSSLAILECALIKSYRDWWSDVFPPGTNQGLGFVDGSLMTSRVSAAAGKRA